MLLRHAGPTAVLILALVPGTLQAQAQPSADEVAPAVDASKLGVDLSRIGRQFTRSRVREERDGLNLRYVVDVFAPAPRIELFMGAKLDPTFWTLPAPYGGPTHKDMLRMMTPKEFSAPVANLGALFNWLNGKR